MKEYIVSLCEDAAIAARSWRRHLHENPELSFQEFETTRYIEKILGSFTNIEIQKPTSTGLVGILRGAFPGKTVAIRADIDALPIEEDPTNDICSKVSGIMHACGHDGHTATLLGTAKVLSALRSELRGTIKFIFQAAEECPPGGAEEMVEAGILDDVDMIFGMHYHVPEDPGIFLIKPGPLYSSTYNLNITINGRGVHAAFPQNGIDIILLASQIVVGISSIIPRCIDNSKRSVLTITGIECPLTYNSIPESISLIGTMRTLDSNAGAIIIKRVTDLCNNYCSIYGASCDVEFIKGYDIVSSTPSIATATRKVLIGEFGESNIIEPTPLIGGEDFSAYLHKVPGCYFRSGTRKRKKDGSVMPPHSSGYEFNDDSLLPSIKAQVAILMNASNML